MKACSMGRSLLAERTEGESVFTKALDELFQQEGKCRGASITSYGWPEVMSGRGKNHPLRVNTPKWGNSLRKTKTTEIIQQHSRREMMEVAGRSCYQRRHVDVQEYDALMAVLRNGLHNLLLSVDHRAIVAGITTSLQQLGTQGIFLRQN